MASRYGSPARFLPRVPQLSRVLGLSCTSCSRSEPPVDPDAAARQAATERSKKTVQAVSLLASALRLSPSVRTNNGVNKFYVHVRGETLQEHTSPRPRTCLRRWVHRGIATSWGDSRTELPPLLLRGLIPFQRLI